jgi:hypothetical protein
VATRSRSWEYARLNSLVVFQLLCVLVAVLASWNLITLLQVYAYFQEKLGAPLPLDERLQGWVLCGSRVVVPIVIVLLTSRFRRPATIGFAIVATWLAFFVLPAANALDSLATEVFVLPGVHRRFVLEVGLGLILSVGATVYLCTSTRVRRTFGRRPRIEGVFD